MKLYLAYMESTALDGPNEKLLGVFDSLEKATECLKKDPDFHKSSLTTDGASYAYHYDGSLWFFWYVKEMELNCEIQN